MQRGKRRNQVRRAAMGRFHSDAEPAGYCRRRSNGRVSQPDYLSNWFEVDLRPVSYTHLDVYKRQTGESESVLKRIQEYL